MFGNTAPTLFDVPALAQHVGAIFVFVFDREVIEDLAIFFSFALHLV